jgi:hypothetical protein
LRGLFFDPEDGSSTFVSNISELLPDYMAILLIIEDFDCVDGCIHVPVFLTPR